MVNAIGSLEEIYMNTQCIVVILGYNNFTSNVCVEFSKNTYFSKRKKTEVTLYHDLPYHQLTLAIFEISPNKQTINF